MSKEYVIWGVPPGQTEEDVLYTRATTYKEARRVVKVLVATHGCTGVRIQVLDLSVDPSELFKSPKVLKGQRRRGGRSWKPTGEITLTEGWIDPRYVKGSQDRSTAYFFLAANKGSARAARGLVGRAIRKTFKVKAWYTEPFLVTYQPAGHAGPDSQGVYTIELTQAESLRLYNVIERMAKAEGWTGPPIDTIHE